MWLRILTLTGRLYMIRMCTSSSTLTIGDLKDRIAILTRVPQCVQILAYCGRIISHDNQYEVSMMRLCEDDTIILTYDHLKYKKLSSYPSSLSCNHKEDVKLVDHNDDDDERDVISIMNNVRKLQTSYKRGGTNRRIIKNRRKHCEHMRRVVIHSNHSISITNDGNNNNDDGSQTTRATVDRGAADTMKLEVLVDQIGFNESIARRALELNHNHIELALNWLLEHNATTAATTNQ